MSRFQTVSMPRQKAEVLNAFMRGVYQWMSLGLALTAGVAFFTASSPALLNALFSNQIMAFVVMLAPFGLVIALSAGINKMSASMATGMFMAYSALMGLSLSTVLIVYTGQSVFSAFVTAAGMFGAMSVYGMTTKKDLTSWGSFLFMGLVGIIIASVVNIFLGSSQMSFIISFLGVIIFTGLTAYDTQKLKVMGETAPANDATAVRRGVILGALTLYLDFINLFLMLLRLMGSTRD
ncbi:Bax inhibitor-1/YccA family protein [Desulfovibrio ferrophilus]|uniref:Membrane protein n=1 Tax=Desulfovibrio ferrophilus TaxID=241368 RepID=A0A2Z6B0K3_9BACT|nr:Bax inhibitor-1/YccA family protein [Desulfovibrio ferrophilus]BBD08985.1 membrane protein [Desulfovibrio ferrophilus]